MTTPDTTTTTALCWRCRRPLTTRTLTVADQTRGTDAVQEWELCSWACLHALVTMQSRAGDAHTT